MGNKDKPNNTQEIIEKNVFTSLKWQENLTVLDLRNRDLTYFDKNAKLPNHLIMIDLSNNKLTEVPVTILKLSKLKTLNLSYNEIQLFDDTPGFCHSLEILDLSNNKLIEPPYWVWIENPQNLVQLNLSNNNSICQSFVEYYFEELLESTTLVKIIDLHNCSLSKHMRLLSTFRHARAIILGTENLDYLSVNHIENIPCLGLKECTEIEILNLCNTHIYNIQHNIDIYKNLIDINLSQNNINSLPNEFCNLENLEICVLSFNKILYLPEDMHKLEKLSKLYLDNNELCMLPDQLCQLQNLTTLDLYNNRLYEGLNDITRLMQYDFAQNYFDEPNDEEYLKKKGNLRQNYTGRIDGRAPEILHEESERSDQEIYNFYSEDDAQEEQQESPCSRSSSPEDWDSDDFWIPSHVDYSNQRRPRLNQGSSSTSPTALLWLDYVKRKMADGNFCPMDMHLSVSITEQVRYEKMCNPKPQYESDGQFDDYSDDDS